MTIGFQGMSYDGIAGLNPQRGRWYSPMLQRWTSVDPLRFGAGDVNLYRTMGNNTVDGLDPSGLDGGMLLPIINIGLWIAQPIRISVPYRPLVGKFGTVFWPVDFSVLTPSDKTNGGWLVQHIKIDWYGFQKEYWEAWPVLPGESIVRPEKPRLPRGPKGTNATFERLYSNLGKGSILLQERIQEKHCDWYVFAGLPDDPKAPPLGSKDTKTATWTGTLYYVQNAKNLPAAFVKESITEAGPLFATQTASQFESVHDWVDKNSIGFPVTHSLKVVIYSNGDATEPTYVAGVIKNGQFGGGRK